MWSLGLGGVRSYAFSVEDCTIEGDLGLPDLAHGAIEDDTMLAGCPHELVTGVGHALQGYDHRCLYHHEWQ